MDNKKSFLKKVKCAIRKWMSAKIIPMMILNGWRIFFYRLCGYKIGKNVFIGMRCYLDDLEPGLFIVEDNVTISYGCYFACHGRNQGHTMIHIKEGAYLGMRTSVVSGKEGVTIGRNSIIGACSLVIDSIDEGKTAVGVPCKVIKGEQEYA